jgi:hypothetical protein
MKCMYNVPPVYHSLSVYSILLWKTSLAAKEASLKSTNFHITGKRLFFSRDRYSERTQAQKKENTFRDLCEGWEEKKWH